MKLTKANNAFRTLRLKMIVSCNKHFQVILALVLRQTMPSSYALIYLVYYYIQLERSMQMSGFCSKIYFIILGILGIN